MAGESVTIVLSLPPKALSPNARFMSRRGMQYKARTTKAYRQAACLAAMAAQGAARPFNWQRATVEARFYFAINRRRDDDNAMAALKAARDGLADSGLLENDAGLIQLPAVMGVDKDRPRVELVVTKAN